MLRSIQAQLGLAPWEPPPQKKKKNFKVKRDSLWRGHVLPAITLTDPRKRLSFN